MYNFYTLRWIKLLLDFFKKKNSIIIDEVILNPSSEEFLFSILYIFRVSEIERLIQVFFNGRNILSKLESPHEFYKIVDHIRKEFADYFREIIVSKDFSDDAYVDLAKEYLLLDEQVTKQIRIPLLDQLKKLTREGKYTREEGKVFEDDKKILRIWKFFTAVELFQKDKKEEILDEAKEYLKDKAKFIIGHKSDNIESFKKVYFENIKSLFELSIEIKNKNITEIEL